MSAHRTGATPERLALAEKVRALRARRLTQLQVAERLGISRSYVSALETDPHGRLTRKRKDSYSGTCLDCGAPTDGSNGPASAPERCARCSPAHLAVWNPALIIERIREYAERYGRPPRALDWNPALARTLNFPDASDRFYADGCWPTTGTVGGYFASFNAAVAAAGFTPRLSGHRIGMRPWPRDAILDAIRQWVATHGELPTCRGWITASEDHPTSAHVIHTLGWNEAIRAAGFTPRRAGDGRPLERAA